MLFLDLVFKLQDFRICGFGASGFRVSVCLGFLRLGLEGFGASGLEVAMTAGWSQVQGVSRRCGGFGLEMLRLLSHQSKIQKGSCSPTTTYRPQVQARLVRAAVHEQRTCSVVLTEYHAQRSGFMQRKALQIQRLPY